MRSPTITVVAAAEAPDRPNDPPFPDSDPTPPKPKNEPDDIPDTPPNEPELVPIRDPRPDTQPPGPYVAWKSDVFFAR
jgi:hypothetical protein